MTLPPWITPPDSDRHFFVLATVAERRDRQPRAHAEVHPKMVRLWNLPSEITNLAFGPKDIFHHGTEEDDLVLQRAGEKFVPQLISGRISRSRRRKCASPALAKLSVLVAQLSWSDQRSRS